MIPFFVEISEKGIYNASCVPILKFDAQEEALIQPYDSLS